MSKVEVYITTREVNGEPYKYFMIYDVDEGYWIETSYMMHFVHSNNDKMDLVRLNPAEFGFLKKEIVFGEEEDKGDKGDDKRG